MTAYARQIFHGNQTLASFDIQDGLQKSELPVHLIQLEKDLRTNHSSLSTSRVEAEQAGGNAHQSRKLERENERESKDDAARQLHPSPVSRPTPIEE